MPVIILISWKHDALQLKLPLRGQLPRRLKIAPERRDILLRLQAAIMRERVGPDFLKGSAIDHRDERRRVMKRIFRFVRANLR